MPIHWDEREIAKGLYCHAEMTDDEVMLEMVRAIAKMSEQHDRDEPDTDD